MIFNLNEKVIYTNPDTKLSEECEIIEIIPNCEQILYKVKFKDNLTYNLQSRNLSKIPSTLNTNKEDVIIQAIKLTDALLSKPSNCYEFDQEILKQRSDLIKKLPNRF